MDLDNLGDDQQGGGAVPAAAAWAVAVALFVLPFLGPADAPDFGVEDAGRKVEPYADEVDDDYVLDLPFEEDVAEFDAWAAEEDLGLESLATLIATSSEELYGEDSKRLAASGLLEMGRLESGRRAYVAQCIGCHGEVGDGSGPASAYLDPRPRNFRGGIFKFTSTASGSKPLRRDLFRTITRGLSGSAMPGFRLLSEERRHDIVEYVRYLSIRGEFEQSMLTIAWNDEELPDPAEIAEIIDGRWDEERTAVVFPSVAETPRDQDSVDRGRALFLDRNGAACVLCHGASGAGDGESATAARDAWGYPIRPRDFTRGVFRAGDDGTALWLTIATGIGGTPMPAGEGALSPTEIWDLVHFTQSLATGQE